MTLYSDSRPFSFFSRIKTIKVLNRRDNTEVEIMPPIVAWHEVVLMWVQHRILLRELPATATLPCLAASDSDSERGTDAAHAVRAHPVFADRNRSLGYLL